MTDPDKLLDPEPEPEVEIEPVPEPFLSKSTLLWNLPYIAALAFAIFGVAYSSFTGGAINGYWNFWRSQRGLSASLPDGQMRLTVRLGSPSFGPRSRTG